MMLKEQLDNALDKKNDKLVETIRVAQVAIDEQSQEMKKMEAQFNSKIQSLDNIEGTIDSIKKL